MRRQPDPGDRRKNVVALTEPGRTTLRRAVAASQQAESRFLGSMPAGQAAALKEALRELAFPASGNPGSRG